MEKITVIFLLCVSLACAKYPKVYDTNDFLDQLHEDLNESATRSGNTTLSIPKESFLGAQLSNGKLFGVNSLTRTGNGTTTVYEDGTQVIEEHWGYKYAVASFGTVEYEGHVSSAVIFSRSNSIYTKLVYKLDGCFFKFLNFDLEHLEWENYEYPPTPRKTFNCVIDELNYKLQLFKDFLEDKFTTICKNSNASEIALQDFPRHSAIHHILYKYHSLINLRKL